MHIPGYKIERELGRGGMATVYLAVQESVGRPVALKVMSAALAADPTFSQRFFHEGKRMGKLSHPSIVSIYDQGVSNHDYYLVLEYIGGGDLKGLIRRGALDPRAAVTIVREIADALGYAHKKETGLVHRDVTPENILFRDNGVAVLTDFGIARAAGGSRLTQMGMAIGKPHYMSPEQARGLTVDGRTDIYALGIVFYEMLTGAVPYDAEETLAIGIKHVTDPVPVLPPALQGFQSLIDRMLAKDPNDRYRTAEELVQAVDNHDPRAKPRTSRPRQTVVMPTATASAAASASGSARSSESATAMKWALIGGAVAVGCFAGFRFIQNQGTVRTVGGGGSAAPPAVPELRVAVPPPIAAPTLAKVEPVSAETTAWTAAQQAASRDAYQSFLNAYPNSSFAALARSRMSKLPPSPGNEDDAWTAAQKVNSKESYERFLKSHPNGTYAVLAQARIKRFK